MLYECIIETVAVWGSVSDHLWMLAAFCFMFKIKSMWWSHPSSVMLRSEDWGAQSMTYSAALYVFSSGMLWYALAVFGIAGTVKNAFANPTVCMMIKIWWYTMFHYGLQMLWRLAVLSPDLLHTYWWQFEPNISTFGLITRYNLVPLNISPVLV